MILDGIGIYGTVLHYALLIALFGSALLFFLHFWRKGGLDMDESPKEQMMKQEDERSPEC